ncbi:hypothetical protein B0H17DRAFT_1126350 [Mycena rosella]|uniref:Uncharacterized protein n=1 Tax=Mycena rosella TaxID=1033263 RepID=A0AAD7M8E7_MYCRO|nr:hypothetical protein B0H17DRAFT_1126350 [Mycena rosella]
MNGAERKASENAARATPRRIGERRRSWSALGAQLSGSSVADIAQASSDAGARTTLLDAPTPPRTTTRCSSPPSGPGTPLATLGLFLDRGRKTPTMKDLKQATRACLQLANYVGRPNTTRRCTSWTWRCGMRPAPANDPMGQGEELKPGLTPERGPPLADLAALLDARRTAPTPAPSKNEATLLAAGHRDP